MHTSVAALDPRCRMLLTLLYYQSEPVPYAAIAQTLGMSEGSIGPTGARCLHRLLRLLRKVGL